MPRKRKTHSRKPTDNSFVNVNATLKKLQSQLTDPRMYYWLFRGAKGVRERILKINYDVIRNVVDKIPLISSSDYGILIQPNNQDWDSFFLDSGTTNTIYISSSICLFIFDKSDYVECFEEPQGTLTFYNRTMLTIRNLTSFNLELIKWYDYLDFAYYFGDDLIWDFIINDWAYGLWPGSSDTFVFVEEKKIFC